MKENEYIAEANKKMSIEELINFLKTTFVKRHFEQVQTILLDRYSQLTDQIHDLTNRNQMLSGRLASEKQQCTTLRERLKKVERERDVAVKEVQLWNMRFQVLENSEGAVAMVNAATPAGAQGKAEATANPGLIKDAPPIQVNDNTKFGELKGRKRTSKECRKDRHFELLNATKKALFKRIRVSYTSSSSEDTSSSSDTDNELVKKPFLQSSWKSEIDLFFAVQKNAELSMKAVCALYKKYILPKKSVEGVLSSNTLGFKEQYVERGMILGKYLTGGNSEGKLTKSVLELNSYDCNALGECQKIAIEHYKQLFEIYQKNEYTFFP